MKYLRYMLLTALILLLSPLLVPMPAQALTNPPPVLGGTARTFAVLGASEVTNTGPTQLEGNLGVSPGSSVTGFPPGNVVGGSIHVTDALAATAKSEASTAFTNASQQPCDVTLTNQDLGTLPALTPKVYCFATTATLTGQLTLNGTGDPNGIYVFKIGTALDATPSSRVSLINVDPCKVFWQVGSAAKLDTNASFAGNIMAGTSINLFTGASSNGGLYALTAAVTLQSTHVTRCFQALAPTPTHTATAVPVRTATNSPTTIPTSTSTTVPSSTPTTVPSSTPTVVPTSTSTTAPSSTQTRLPTATTVNTAVPTLAARSPTATVAALATGTPVPASTSTAGAASTSTPMPAATKTAVAASTSTSVAASTSTAIAASTSTEVAAATKTAVAASTSTFTAESTSTSVAAATKIAVAANTGTSVAAATATAVAASTSTAVSIVINTAQVTETAQSTGTALATSTAQATSTNTVQATSTAVPRPSPTAKLPNLPHTGVAMPGPGGGSGPGSRWLLALIPGLLLCAAMVIAVRRGANPFARLRRL